MFCREMFLDIIPAPVRNVYIGTAQFAECKRGFKHLNSSAYSALYLWSYFILRFFLGGVS